MLYENRFDRIGRCGDFVALIKNSVRTSTHVPLVSTILHHNKFATAFFARFGASLSVSFASIANVCARWLSSVSVRDMLLAMNVVWQRANNGELYNYRTMPLVIYTNHFCQYTYTHAGARTDPFSPRLSSASHKAQKKALHLNLQVGQRVENIFNFIGLDRFGKNEKQLTLQRAPHRSHVA